MTRQDVQNVLGITGANVVFHALDAMEWAEEELGKIFEDGGPNGLFSICYPRIPNIPEGAYRAHVRQLAEWFKGDKHPIKATDAEALVVLMELSFRAPLKRDFMGAYCLVFSSCFPDKGTMHEGLVTDNDLEAGRVRLEEIKDRLCKELGAITTKEEEND
jgi:hypothetical protein